MARSNFHQLWDAAENVEIQVKRVTEIDCVKEALDKGAIEIYGMLYDLRTGKVSCLSKNGATSF